MADQYVRTALRLGWLLQDVEQTLSTRTDGCRVDANFIRTCATRRLPTQDEITAVTVALVDLDILHNEGHSFCLRKQSLLATKEFRSGVWKTLGVVRAEDNGASTVQLCATAPPGLDSIITCHLYEDTIELRAAIVSLIASAQKQLILASPFWDEETADEIGDLIEKRLAAGVSVTILGRFSEPNASATMAILHQLSKHQSCKVASWFSTGKGDYGVQTFHFKAIVADHGRLAYLGSANLTTSGLRSRMELGVILSNAAARQLYRVICVALNLAEPAFRIP
jgi:phosphatidylserine/phosphatidylglycerophosphate/cardiolipin synthase-like enzyme